MLMVIIAFKMSDAFDYAALKTDIISLTKYIFWHFYYFLIILCKTGVE